MRHPFGLIALCVIGLFATACSADYDAPLKGDLMGNCANTTATYGHVKQHRTINDPVIVIQGGIDTGVHLTADGPRPCILVDTIADDVTLTATGPGATIIVLNADAQNFTIRASGSDALVVLNNYPEHDGYYSGITVDGGQTGRLIVNGARIAA